MGVKKPRLIGSFSRLSQSAIARLLSCAPFTASQIYLHSTSAFQSLP